MTIKILDCTLRDGGYINNWMFGEDNIKFIIRNLMQAKIDFIETGFLKPRGIAGTTIYDGVFKGENPAIKYIRDFPNQNFTLMMNVGEFDVHNLYNIRLPLNLFIRLAFRKNFLCEALEIAEKLTSGKSHNDSTDLGYLKTSHGTAKIFLSPMFTNTYTKKEMNYLIDGMNVFEPYALSITDTSGAFQPKELLNIFKYIDKRLSPKTALAFHSHNNLNLSCKNAFAAADAAGARGVILDGCIAGMGRGAGNLDTILAIKKLDGYDIKPLKELEKKVIVPIYRKTPWGVSQALYCSAKCGCHPDYGIYLEKSNVKTRDYKKILSSIPAEFKFKFNKQIIETRITEAGHYWCSAS